MCEENEGWDSSPSYSSPEPTCSAPEPEPVHVLETTEYECHDLDILDDDDLFDSRSRNSYTSRKGNTMDIDFNRLANAGAHASTLDFSKAQAVGTAERINFSKDNPGVTKIRMELYWESNHDGDASVMIMGADGKALPGTVAGETNPNKTRGMVWYNNLSVPGVSHSGDTRSSNDGDASIPEETIHVDLAGLEADADAVLAVASTFPEEGTNTPVAFGKLRDCKVMIINDLTNEVLYVYELDEDFSTFTSVELAKFYKRNGEWRFTSMGMGVGTAPQALSDIAKKYGLS